MNVKFRDIVLVSLVLGLILLALAPEEKETSVTSPRNTAPAQTAKSEYEARDNFDPVFSQVDDAVTALNKHNRELETALESMASHPPAWATARRRFAPANPADVSAGLHQVFPLEAGTTWVYRVSGLSTLGTSDTWTMRVIAEPLGNQPGLIESGFGTNLTVSRVWLDYGAIRFAGLPFVEPLDLTGGIPSTVTGKLVPHPKAMIEEAVWTMETQRDVVYRYKDEKEKSYELAAVASQQDRARVIGFESIIVPAGSFGAHRIQWRSRIEIETKDDAKTRTVLERLTTEPFRRELMWVAPGIGIVRREIDYREMFRGKEVIVFELIRYVRPDYCVFEDLHL
jgi:hypothetical protein